MPSKKNAGKFKDCHFTKDEQVALTRMFKELTKINTGTAKEDRLDRSQFRDVLHSVFKMTDNVMMDSILRVFDTNSDSYIDLCEWITGLSVFLKGTLEEKMDFCFKVFDLNGDGYISREEMFQLLKNSIIKQPTEEDPEEGIKELVEITLKKMDIDHDGKLSLADYRESIQKENLLLECLGPVLPDHRVIDSFMAMFAVPNP